MRRAVIVDDEPKSIEVLKTLVECFIDGLEIVGTANDIETAIREFVEETGLKYKNINVYRNIKPIEELYTGINGVVYKHIYFIADIKDTQEANENMIRVEKGGFLNYEVSNIKAFSLTEAHKLIRPYYVSKLNAIKKGFEIIESINTYFE